VTGAAWRRRRRQRLLPFFYSGISNIESIGMRYPTRYEEQQQQQRLMLVHPLM
jgi:hypothetical protein